MNSSPLSIFKLCCSGVFLLPLLPLGGNASAAVLALYPFNTGTVTNGTSGTPGGGFALSTDTDADSAASSLSAVGTGVNMLESSGWGNPASSGGMQQALGTSQATAISANDYWSFTLTPNAGQLNLTSLTLDYSRSATTGSPTALFIRSSVDSYTANLLLDTAIPASPSFDATSIDLSGALFQGLSSPITFRLYAYGATVSTASLRFDNITLNGAVAVPEPNAVQLSVAGLILLLKFRRNRSGNFSPSRGKTI